MNLFILKADYDLNIINGRILIPSSCPLLRLLSLSSLLIFNPQIQLLKTHSIAQSTVQVASFMKELWVLQGIP